MLQGDRGLIEGSVLDVVDIVVMSWDEEEMVPDIMGCDWCCMGFELCCGVFCSCIVCCMFVFGVSVLINDWNNETQIIPQEERIYNTKRGRERTKLNVRLKLYVDGCVCCD